MLYWFKLIFEVIFLRYKLVALDCDNTLLDKYGNICDINKKVIQKLRENGVDFVIATGRNDILAKDYAEELDLKVPIISCNGAMVSNLFTGEVFMKNAIPPVAIDTVFDCLTRNKILFKILTDKACYTNDEVSMRLGIGQIVKNYTRELKYSIPYHGNLKGTYNGNCQSFTGNAGKCCLCIRSFEKQRRG